MKSEDKGYVWQRRDWPHWVYDRQRLAPLLAQVHRAQGHLLGRMHNLGLDLRDQAMLRVLTEDVLKTSEIEGEKLNTDSVRSSIARRLGVDIGALAPIDRQVDGVVDMVLDATLRHHEPLTADRLLGWHAALFPTGYSSLTKIRVGQWRDDAQGPMQVVSGHLHRQKVHYEAPPAHLLDAEVLDFLNWFNLDTHDDPVIKAGLAQVQLLHRLQNPVTETELDQLFTQADQILITGDAAEAFNLLLARFAVDFDLRDQIRARLLDLFTVTGDSHQAVLEARRKLASLMF
jgi:Fic family protein